MEKAKPKTKKIAIQKVKKVPVKKVLSFMEKLLNVQCELKAPKDKKNVYGGFNYRSCEDILREVKPLLLKYRLLLTLDDRLVRMKARFYVKSIATLEDLDSDLNIKVTGYAREEETKKGMDGSQVTGASSSYARKYALNGLFGIDDGVDSDTTNVGKTAVKKENLVSEAEMKALAKFLEEINNAKTMEELKRIGERFMNGAKIGKFNKAQVAIVKKAFTGRQMLLKTKK